MVFVTTFDCTLYTRIYFSEPLGEYRSDMYIVEEPTVSKRSKDVYSRYVQCGQSGPSEPSKANRDMYRMYVKQLYQWTK